MYIPKEFKIENKELAFEFIQKNNFGLLLCNGEDVPLTTHLPFFLEQENETISLITHLAKENPQWQTLEKNNNCLIIFSGANGYVSPSLYSSSRNVPTWNYMAVHLKVKAKVIHDTEEKKRIMHQTIQVIEPAFLKQYNELAPEYLHAMYNAITGLKFEITGIETKFKLSQNKPEEDKRKVADFFENTGNKILADWMRKINSSNT
ncbi:MAG: FMN-binding negative transcriptional regulator [Bacteroidia bacterium]|nr:FMN-binding negative transcriptional regulator [Bacteroidia bacterium]